MEQIDLLQDVALVLGVALLASLGLRRLGQPLVVGYFLVGIALGPFGLGLIGDLERVQPLATLGVALLMFALGVEFSLGELRRIGRVASLGGLLQIGITTLVGTGIALALSLPNSSLEVVFFGFLIAFSSTLVLLKTLQERGELQSLHGRISLGILIVQDLSVVPLIVILPALAGPQEGLATEFSLALLRAGLLLGLVILLGFRLVPWFLERVAALRSREIFLLCVVGLCLGAALGSALLGLSITLGAFLAGLTISESPYAHQALADVLPLRDIFAILFFVSIGMLTDLNFVLAHWAPLLVISAAVMIAKFSISWGIVRLFGYQGFTGIFVGAGLIQVGEFSFILAQEGVDKGAISTDIYSLVLGSAMITIILTPFALELAANTFRSLHRLGRPAWLLGPSDPSSSSDHPPQRNHVIVCGGGRVGSQLLTALERRNLSALVIDLDPGVLRNLSERGIPTIYGEASNPAVLTLAGITRARVLVVALPDPIATELIVDHAHRLNPRLDIVVRSHHPDHLATLHRLGATEVVQAELEAALELTRHTLHRFGLSSQEIQHFISGLREEGYLHPPD